MSTCVRKHLSVRRIAGLIAICVLAAFVVGVSKARGDTQAAATAQAVPPGAPGRGADVSRGVEVGRNRTEPVDLHLRFGNRGDRGRRGALYRGGGA